jgi:hypothetical protein
MAGYHHTAGGMMKITERLLPLVLRTYPPAFREAHGEEILGTVAERRDAGEPGQPARDLASLLLGGMHQRWLVSTGGSLAATLRQGLAWGVLLCLVREAGFAVSELVSGLVHGWPGSDSPVNLLVTLGWLTTFCLLASGRGRWGLVVLTLLYAYFLSGAARDLGGPHAVLDAPFTVALRTLPPVLLPLLAAYAWPSRGVRLPPWSWIPLLALATIVPPVSTLSLAVSSSLFGFVVSVPYGLLVAVALVGAVIVVAASWSDPRWIVGTALVLVEPAARALLSDLTRRDLTAFWLHGAVLWIIVVAVVLVTVRRVRPLARL